MYMPTQERLRKVFCYCEETGVVEWIKTVGSRARVGDIASFVSTTGYMSVGLDQNKYHIHRLIWVYMTGEIPNTIDHINGDILDNRWSNLRNTNMSGNNKNSCIPKNNTSGFIGVSFEASSSRWKAQIQVSGKTENLGRYRNIGDAVKARVDAEAKYGYHINHGRNSKPIPKVKRPSCQCRIKKYCQCEQWGDVT